MTPVVATVLACMLAATAGADAPMRIALRREQHRVEITPELLEAAGNEAHNSSSLSSPGLRMLVTRHLARGGGRRMQDAMPLYGDFLSIAYFYATLFVGTPPQPAAVITDTGSSLTAFPCTTCTQCGRHINPPYDPAASTTGSAVSCDDPGSCSGCSNNQCEYRQSYMEGSSISGLVYADRAFIGVTGDPHAPPHEQYSLPAFQFGCHLHEGGLFSSQLADGIMGIGHGRRSYVRALWDSGVVDRHMFSLCLTPDGGAMTVGAIDHAIHMAPPQWAAMSTTDFYAVTTDSFALGTK